MSTTSLKIEKAQLIGDFIMSSWSEDEINAILNIAKKDNSITWNVKPTLDFIFKVVCHHFNQSEQYVLTKTRNWDASYPRHVFAYMVYRIYQPQSLEETGYNGLREKSQAGLRQRIADFLDRSGAAINNSLKVINNFIDYDEAVKADLRYIESDLYRRFINGQN